MVLVLRGRHPGPSQCDGCLLWFTDLHVGITKRLKTVEVLEGEGCSFECILSHEDTGDTAMWMVGGKTVGASGRFQATRQGRKFTLAVQEAVLGDTGEVVFSVRGLTSRASLIVKGEHHGPGADRASLCAELGFSPRSLQQVLGLGSLPGVVSGDCLPQPLVGTQRLLLGCWQLLVIQGLRVSCLPSVVQLPW